MRILFTSSKLSFVTYHGIAKRIKAVYRNSKFAFYGCQPEAINFLKNQKEINYQHFFLNDFDHNKDNLINYKYLKNFEDNLPYKSLWRVIATDRNLGRSFLHGVLGYDYKNYKDKDYILKYCTFLIKASKKMFNDFKPDVFIPAMAMGSIETIIFEQICIEKGVLYLVPDSLRVKNYCSLSTTHQIEFLCVNEHIRKLILNNSNSLSLKAKKLYSDLNNNYIESEYFDHYKNTISQKHLISSSSYFFRIRYIFIIIPLQILLVVIRWFRELLLRLFGRKDISFGQSLNLYKIIKQKIGMGIQKIKITHPNFGVVLDKKQKYIFFPLSGQPEYSNNLLGTMWMDHHHLIETLAKSIPSDWVVYVKEHPGISTDRLRPLDFYKKIQDIPNVFLAPVFMNSRKIISNAQMVAVISGTAGFEAIWMGKPLIEFRSNIWSSLNLSRKCTDIENLSAAIVEESKRIKLFSNKERKKRLTYFLDAALKYGFHVTYPEEMFYLKKGTQDQYELCGKEIADNIIKHINLIKKLKGLKFDNN